MAHTSFLFVFSTIQDPEIMREAQKMMQDPAFQAQMKKMTESSGFKQHMTASQDMLKDPEKVKELEDKMQEKLKEGNDLLEKAKADRDAAEGTKKDDMKEEDGDKKEAKKKEEEVDDMPDIPSLNLNWVRNLEICVGCRRVAMRLA